MQLFDTGNFFNYSEMDQNYFRASPRNRVPRSTMFNLCLRLEANHIVRVAKIIFPADGSIYIDFPGYHNVGGATTVVDSEFWGDSDGDMTSFFEAFNRASKLSSITPKYSHHPGGHASFSKDGYIAQKNTNSFNLKTKSGPRQILNFCLRKVDRFKTFTPKINSPEKTIVANFNLKKNEFIGGTFRFMWSDYHSLRNNVLFDNLDCKPVGIFGIKGPLGGYEIVNNHDLFYACDLISPPYGFKNRHYALIIAYESQTVGNIEELEKYFCHDSIILQGGLSQKNMEFLTGVYPHPDYERLSQTNESIDYVKNISKKKKS